MNDLSNGYEGVAAEFLSRRSADEETGIGVAEVRAWVRLLRPGAAVIDLGCGSGLPLTKVLVSEGLTVFGVDAAPSMVDAFRRNLPDTPVVCEAVEDSRLFDRRFDGVLAWGLVFLLSADAQRRLLERVSAVVAPGGRFLFTAPAQAVVWQDAVTGLESRSLGAEAYSGLLRAAGFSVAREFTDCGENHYFDVVRDGACGV